MRGVKRLRYLKAVRARGKLYGYFDTGQKDAKGKRIYSALGRMDARDFEARYAAMLGHRTRRAQVAETMTVKRLVDLFQRSPKYAQLAANSKRVYDLYLNHLAASLPTAPAGEIERKEIILLLDEKADKPAAANLMLGIYRSLYRWGRQREHVANDPCAGIDPFDIGEHEPWPEWLLDLALTSDNERVRLAVHLLYYTAQRIGDVIAMQWTDIEGEYIFVKQQKTEKVLQIRLHRDLQALLASTPKRGFTIITKANGSAVSQDWLRTSLQVWAKKNGAKIVPHGLRKNAVNTLLESGCSAAEAAAISGQSLAMVEHYAKRRAQPKLGSAAVLKWERNR